MPSKRKIKRRQQTDKEVERNRKMTEQPASASRATEGKNTCVIEPETKGKNSKVAGQHFEQPGVPVLAADSDGKLLGEAGLRALNEHIKQKCKPEQPNTELLIVKTIQGLTTCINNELEKLCELTYDKKMYNLIAKTIEVIASFEKNELYELQKAFE